jgi:hypothetical protein
MIATRQLPPDYHASGVIDISKDRRLMYLLNVLGLIMLPVSGWLFLRAMVWMRTGLPIQDINLEISGSLLQILVTIFSALILIMVDVVLHEAIHGVFFWLFTRDRPVFAFRWTHAYAAAPDWFIARGPFMVTTLAPLVVISLAGIAAMRFVPVGWLTPIWFVLTFNAAGAIGDLLVFVWLLRQPPNSLVQDRGDAVTFYQLKG